MMPVRYIRDWCFGNTQSANCNWCEIQAMTSSAGNVAVGCTTSASNGGTPSVVTDGSTVSGTHYDIIAPSSPAWVMVDLGAVRFDVASVAVWRVWSDGRTYHGTKTEVSSDGVTWYAIFDSAVSGEYTETSSGKTSVVPGSNFTLYAATGVYFCPSLPPEEPHYSMVPSQYVARSAGGVAVGFDSVTKYEVATFHWPYMPTAETESLTAFFAAIGFMAGTFTVSDVDGASTHEMDSPAINVSEKLSGYNDVSITLRRYL